MGISIGKKIKNLRLKKGLTQEELGERTDLSKGYISQIERDLSSPSIETFFNILEVLGCSPKEFFDDNENDQKVVYGEEDQTEFVDEELGYRIQWLVLNRMNMIWNRLFSHWNREADSNNLNRRSGNFCLCARRTNCRGLGKAIYRAKQGIRLFYASSEHQIINDHDGASKIILVATESYL